MTMAPALWHVMFDGKEDLECHVCPRHKAIADMLACDDAKGDNGECAHVQYRACDCTDPEMCAYCEVSR